MIKVSNLDKTYYKGKQNEIHVINNTSLELPDKGLICFLGQSGSGKTTLLNTIGGLDKQDKGSIQYDDKLIKKYNMKEVDKFRSEHIGYIFQNYLLLEDVTVYENLRIALELIGITDSEEVKKRIEYVLKAVGLFKFRRKLAGQLSGGQMQRVSIARALIKKTKIIIADEPTGNLDSENTIEVMNILKKISKDTLVLVVTHNNEIASFYADRIVSLKDGVVEKDYENESTGSLESKSDKKIHLLDLERKDIVDERVSIKLYTDGDTDAHNITLVLKNNTLYIDGDTRIQVVEGSNIELLEDHYKKLEINNVDTFDYDISWYDDTKKNNRFVEGLKSLGREFLGFYGASKRMFFNIVFILIGVAIAILVVTQTNLTDYDASSVPNEENLYYIEGFGDKPDYCVDAHDVIEASKKGLIQEIVSKRYGRQEVVLQYNSVNHESIGLHNNVFPYENVENKGIFKGATPKKTSDIVLGKAEADYLIENSGGKLNYDSIIGLKLSGGGNSYICGISNANTNCIYVYNYSEGSNHSSPDNETVEYLKDDIKNELVLIEGHYPENDGEVIVSDKTGLVSGDFIYYNGEKIGDVVGIYTDGESNMYTKDYSLLKYCYYDGFSLNLKEMVTNYEYEAVIRDNFFEYDIVLGEAPKSADECIVSIYSTEDIGNTIYPYNMKVVGKFIPKEETYQFSSGDWISTGYTHTTVLTTREGVITCRLYDYIKYDDFGTYSSQISGYYYFISSDKLEDAKKFFEGKSYSIIDVYSYEKNELIAQNKETKKVYPIVEAVLLVIILVYTYFSERAKMINDVYDIGVLRSLGCKRRRIVGKMLKELFVKATLTTLLGYAVTILVYYIIAGQINSVVGTKLLATNPIYIFLGVIILYASQMLIGLIPYGVLLRKTPSEINSKYDI